MSTCKEPHTMMTTDDWWTRWCVLWYAVGWRALAAKSNYNVEDALDVCSALLVRIARLEIAEQRRFPFFGLF